MLQKLNQATLEVRLSMNLKKIKVMYNEFAKKVEEPITIDSNEIDEVDHYIYLHGFRLEGTRDQTSYHPRIAFGSETWNRKKQQTLKLRIMQRDHERMIVNITWRNRKTAQWIREKTKVLDIMETISKLKWN